MRMSVSMETGENEPVKCLFGCGEQKDIRSANEMEPERNWGKTDKEQAGGEGEEDEKESAPPPPPR